VAWIIDWEEELLPDWRHDDIPCQHRSTGFLNIYHSHIRQDHYQLAQTECVQSYNPFHLPAYRSLPKDLCKDQISQVRLYRSLSDTCLLLLYKTLLSGYFSFELLIQLIIVLLFRFIYFIIFIFLVVVGLRLIFEITGLRMNNVFVSFVYSFSDTVVRPLRNFFRLKAGSGFDFHVLIALAFLILLRFLVLPKLLQLILMVMR
jgi:uncharacterized protein YggT (Ycf19 family)